VDLCFVRYVGEMGELDTARRGAVDSSADDVDVRAACTSALRTPIADVANVRAAYTRSLWARLDVSRS
jgi:hypothetical protein